MKKILLKIKGDKEIFAIYLSLLFANFYFLFLFFFPNPVQVGGDAIIKWQLAKELVSGNFNYIQYLHPVDSHHHFRWGIWLPLLPLIKIFGDSVAIYYLHSTIFFILGFNFFYIFLFKVFKDKLHWFAILISLVIFISSSDIFDYLYNQLLPSNFFLLPFSLIVFSMYRYFLDINIKKNNNKLNLLFIILSFFYLWGVKEQYIFFIVPIIIYLFYLNKKHAFYFLFGFIGLVFFESLVFYLLNDCCGFLPKLNYLFNFVERQSDGADFANKLAKNYFDFGFSLRWYESKFRPPMIFLYIFGFVISTLIFSISTSKKSINFFELTNKQVAILLILALFYISFFLIITFYTTNLSSPKIGLAFRARYLFPLFPILIFLLCLFFSFIIKTSRIKIISSFLLFFICYILVMPSIHFNLAKLKRSFSVNAFQVDKCIDSYVDQMKSESCSFVPYSKQAMKFANYQDYLVNYNEYKSNFREIKIHKDNKFIYKGINCSPESKLNAKPIINCMSFR